VDLLGLGVARAPAAPVADHERQQSRLDDDEDQGEHPRVTQYASVIRWPFGETVGLDRRRRSRLPRSDQREAAGDGRREDKQSAAHGRVAFYEGG
jgi:hypothetical protein